MAYPSPLAALRAYARRFAEMGESPGALAHHFAYLQLDLRDPAFHREALAAARTTRAALRELLEAAVTAGELPADDRGGSDSPRCSGRVERIPHDLGALSHGHGGALGAGRS